MFVAACPLTMLITPSFGQTCACPSSDAGPASSSPYLIQADEPPPPLPEYEQPPIPAPGYNWTPGYWAWNNDDYYWVPGAWVEPPQPGLLWTPGFWAFVGGVYAFRPGYWGHEVGYYGGVDYGYGYGGSGYQGGRWDNGHFFYNTAVNNIGGARIANVYNQPIVRNATVNRASFSGGPGGVVAAPTAAQSALEKAQHVPPTAAQRNQARLASVERTQFATANQGKPSVAATERPGEFKGKGAVPAKAAGKAALATPAQTPASPPGGNALPQGTPPAAEKPIKPEAAPAAPNAATREEKAPTAVRPPAAVAPPGKPPGVEKPPAAATKPPTTAARPPAAAEKPPVAAKPPVAERPPVAAKPPTAAAKPPAAAERTPERPPVAEKPAPRPEPNAAAQRMIERPQAPAVAPKPAQPERRPPGECGRPGLPPCPK